MNRPVQKALAILAAACFASSFVSAVHAQDHENSIGLSIQSYTPTYDQARYQYDNAVAMSFTYEYLSDKSSFLRAGVGFLKHSGDAYGRHFIDGPRSTQALMPLELSVGYRAPLSDDGGHAIIVGLGAQYLSYWESYPGVKRVAAQGIGAIFYVGPELAITKSLRIGLEYRVLVGDVQVRIPGQRYEVDLSGSFLQLAVRRVL